MSAFQRQPCKLPGQVTRLGVLDATASVFPLKHKAPTAGGGKPTMTPPGPQKLQCPRLYKHRKVEIKRKVSGFGAFPIKDNR